MRRKVSEPSLKYTLLLLGLFLAMMLVMRFTAGRVAAFSDGREIIDLRFGISIRETSDAIAGYTERGALLYRFLFLAVDAVYALCYCAFYRNAIRYFCTRKDMNTAARSLLVSLPVIGMTADLLENTVLFILLGGKSQPVILCGAFTVFNFVKFVFVYLSLAAVLIGAVMKLILSLRHTYERRKEKCLTEKH